MIPAMIGLMLCISHKPQAASSDSIRKALFKTNDAAEQVRLYIALSKTYNEGNSDSAEICLKKALNLARSLKLSEPLGDVYFALGRYARLKNRLDEALHNFKLAQVSFSKANQTENYVRMEQMMGIVCAEMDNLPEAISHYLEGIKLAEEQHMKHLLAELNMQMGLLFLESNDKQATLEYFRKAIKYFTEVGDSVLPATPYLYMGYIYLDLESYEMATNYAGKAKSIFEKRHATMQESVAIVLMSQIESKQGHHLQALALVNQSLILLNKEDKSWKGPRDYALSQFYADIGGVYMEAGRMQEAMMYLKKAYSISIKLDQPKTLSRIAEKLSILHERHKNQDSALFYYKIFHLKSDSLSKATSINTFKLTEIRNDFEKKQKDAEQKLNNERLQRINILIISIISVIILLAIVLILFLKLRLEKEKKKKADLEKTALDAKLEYQNKEMTTNVMYLNKMNEQVVRIAEKLQSLQIEEDSDNSKIIRSIAYELKQGSGYDSLKEFEMRFQNVHKDFYRNLTDKFPDLTPNELKLCAYLRLNMSTKDISSLTYQNENSIGVARTRLRQKFGITRHDNLITFLAQF
ncbi:MAG: tetratricopeptide repeat protein [Bacteroidales bacterium]